MTRRPTILAAALAAPLALGLSLLARPAAAQDQEAAEQQEATAAPEQGRVIGAKLQGLDKITARIFAFDAPFDEAVSFGYLAITVRDCVVSAEDAAPERSAFLEIVAAKPDTDAVEVFSGWMFASSPSVSAMEHPVYDVWVTDCLLEGEAAAAAAEETVKVPPLIVGDEVQLPTDEAERPLD